MPENEAAGALLRGRSSAVRSQRGKNGMASSQTGSSGETEASLVITCFLVITSRAAFEFWK